MISREALVYRPCVGIMLLNANGLVWVGRRRPIGQGDFSGHMWQMPQGGIDKGESPEQAALRELKEEAGTNKATILSEIEDWLYYDLPDEFLGKGLKGKFRGQKQKWFAMRFEGHDGDIDLNGDGAQPPEFDQWKWVEMACLPQLIVPFKRDVYTEVVAAFSGFGS